MVTPRRARISVLLVCASLALIACGNREDAHRSTTSTAASAPILLFNGTGASPNDVTALEGILNRNRLRYSEANSRQLNEMAKDEMRVYQLVIVPGGDFVAIGNGLKSRTTANLRDAVQQGLNYLGICAGGFFAGNSPYNGLNLTSGVRFSFYSAESRGIRKAAVPIASPGAPTLDQYWEDGPQFTGWGNVLGKYPDGTPAIVGGRFGDGWVILAGIHAEAPASWRRGLTFATPVDVDHAYAARLINAALNRAPLAHY